MASLKPGTLKKVVRALEGSDDSGPSADEVKGYPRVRIEGLRLAPKVAARLGVREIKGKWYVEVWFAMRRGRESPYRDVWGVVFDKRSVPLDVEIPLELVLNYGHKQDFGEKVLAWIAAESGLKLRGRLGQKTIVLTLAWKGGQSESPCERAPLFESTFVRPRRS